MDQIQMCHSKDEQIEELKRRYNEIIEKQKMSANWLDNPKTKRGEKISSDSPVIERAFIKYRMQLDVINSTIYALKELGYTMTSQEVLNGFRG